MRRQKEIERKIEKIKKLDRKSRYQFTAPAAQEELSFFEQKYQVHLPQDFTYFVTHIANGIKDSRYNRTILDQIDFSNYMSDLEDMSHNPYFAFPATQTARAGWSGYEYEDLTNGSITLSQAEYGCGYKLIVNGKAQGQVWGDGLALSSKVFPSHHTFENWLNHRLDAMLREVKSDTKVWRRFRSKRRSFLKAG